MLKKLLYISLFFTLPLFAAEYSLNFKGEKKENLNIKLDLAIDEEGKPLKEQKFDLRGFGELKSLKIVTASGLVGTLKDEREIIAYYKTNLNVNGLKIRNLYKVAVARVYTDEKEIQLNFDPDHYQNIVSFLRYHNVKQDVIKDIDNMYGTWNEILNEKQNINKEIVDGGELK